MVAVDLASDDGSAGTLVDTHVWVDCIDATSPWRDWAVDRLQSCSERAPLPVNIAIYTERLVPRPSVAALDELPDMYDTRRSALPWAGAALAAAAFAPYRRRGGPRHKPLPDFPVGAHAAVSNLAMLTRDPAPCRTCLPKLAVMSP